MAPAPGSPRTDGGPYDVALSTAFPAGDGPAKRPAGAALRVRLHPYAIAFVAGFPGLLGVTALGAAMSRGGTNDGAFPLGAVLLGAAATLLALGLGSYLAVDEQGVTVRFYGARSTRVRFDELVAATFGMSFPSISFNVALKDRRGSTARVHANWWSRERDIMAIVLRELLDRDVSMDRQTAALVARTLKVEAPAARIVHRALLRRDRTW